MSARFAIGQRVAMLRGDNRQDVVTIIRIEEGPQNKDYGPCYYGVCDDLKCICNTHAWAGNRDWAHAQNECSVIPLEQARRPSLYGAELLKELHDAAVLQRVAGERIERLVAEMRQRTPGVSWSRIGAMLGVTKQAAAQRFAAPRPADEDMPPELFAC